MSWFWYLLTIILLSFIGIMLSQLKIKIFFNKEDDNDLFVFDIWFLYIFHYKKSIPLVEFDNIAEGIKLESETDFNQSLINDNKKSRITLNNVKKYYKHYKMISEHIHDLKKLIKNFTKHVHIVGYKWETTIGTYEASYTGILTGIAWGIKSFIIGLLSSNTLLEIEPVLIVIPEYNNKIFKSKFQCILRFRVGYFIVTSMRLLFRYLIGGSKIWQENIPSKA